MKIKVRFIGLVVFFLFAVVCVAGSVWLLPRRQSGLILEKTWEGYKKNFISSDGRVVRPREQDTVSEGQAYAMLRAVVMNDRRTFDACYQWTDRHLSRRKSHADNLLAWRWKEGAVVDSMPASDADIDYALALLIAARMWGQGPVDAPPYEQTARRVLADILVHETARVAGRLYLLPWILDPESAPKVYPLNPSYFSPAHFMVFYQVTGDERWLELRMTGYDLLQKLSRRFIGVDGVGLFPDWCGVDVSGHLVAWEGKSHAFGWEAVRIPFRLMLDYLWFEAREPALILAPMQTFLESEWKQRGWLASEYDYDGRVPNPYENAMFYAAYCEVAGIARSPLVLDWLKKARSFLIKGPSHWVYQSSEEYFVNSLTWIPEAHRSGHLVRMREVLRDKR